MTAQSLSELTVFVVDDDPSVRDALSLLLGIYGHRVSVHESAESFLRVLGPALRGCILLDIRMPGMDGLTLQKHLVEAGAGLPVIIMTGHGDVASAREAFRNLAVDFLEKPLDHSKLLAAISEALGRQKSKINLDNALTGLRKRISALTPRELEVMNHVVSGRHNREIASALGISARTVEVHKARMMDKLDVSNVADLVRMSIQLDRNDGE